MELNKEYTYGDLTRGILNEEPKKGGSKAKQMKAIKCLYKIEQKGRKYILVEKYDNPMIIIDGRYTAQYSPSYLVPKEHNDSIGVYSITLDNKIYIGSTTSSFRKRFLGHRRKQNPLPTREMLENGAVFEILQICKGMDEPSIREIENDYIQEYKSNSEYEVVNVKNSWSLLTKEPKRNYKSIKVAEEDFEDILKIMEEKGIDYKL